MSIQSPENQPLRTKIRETPQNTYKFIKLENKTTDNISNDPSKVKSIALACAVTSKGKERVDISNHHLIKDFLPSFCETASKGYEYSFYLR